MVIVGNSALFHVGGDGGGCGTRLGLVFCSGNIYLSSLFTREVQEIMVNG